MDAQAEKIHNISQLLKAYCLYEKDVQYVVQDDKVIIVDENTGREMPGRRWSRRPPPGGRGQGRRRHREGNPDLRHHHHPELLPPLREARRHDRHRRDRGRRVLTTSTSSTCCRSRPTAPNSRVDDNDQVFKTRREKFNAVIAQDRGSPRQGPAGASCGTASVESSETLSRMLKRAKIPHTVLNAKFHEQEAEIVARAGQRGAVTVSTNMAGRGTDIKLGARRRRTRRPLRHRHRAPRVAPHRPPAARPLRPPGRPRPLAVLHLASRTT